jgi:CRP-like cAMP-binding protein
LHRLRIFGTSDRKFRGIVQNLVQARCADAEDINDVSTMLQDTRMKWSFFDIIERDMQPLVGWPPMGLICKWSIVGQAISTLLAMIALYSVWYATLVWAFDEIIQIDPMVGPGTVAYQALEGIAVSADLVYFLGTLTRLRTTIIDPTTSVETCDPERIRLLTLRSFFFYFDLISCVPHALLEMALESSPVWLRCTKLIRFRHFLPWVTDWQGGNSLVMGNPWQQVLRLVLIIVITGHCMGCFWYRVSKPAAEKHPLLVAAAGGEFWKETSDYSARPLFLFYTYFGKTGLYLTLGIIVQGYSQVENALIFFLAPVGSMVSAYVFSCIVVLVSRSSANKTKEMETSSKLKQAFRTQNLPASLQLRIFAYHTQQRVHRCSSQSQTLFRDLSDQLKFELNLVLYFNLIMEAEVFKKSHPRVLRQIVLVFEDKLFLPGDYVCRYNDEGTEMYFIFKGRCTVLSENHSVLKVMNKGEHFGEVSLLTGQRRTAFVRSNLFSALASLAKHKFEEIMREYPEQLDLILETMSNKQRQWMQRLVHEKRVSQSCFSPELEDDDMANTRRRQSMASALQQDATQARRSKMRGQVRVKSVCVKEEPEPGQNEKGEGQDASSASNSDESNAQSRASSPKSPKFGSEDEMSDKGHNGEWETEEEEESDDKEDEATDISHFIAMIGKRCHVALEIQDQICKRLLDVATRQGDCSKIAKGLKFSLNSENTDEAREERTVMLEYVCSDVEVMRKAITEEAENAHRNQEASAKKMSPVLNSLGWTADRRKSHRADQIDPEADDDDKLPLDHRDTDVSQGDDQFDADHTVL